MEKNMENEMEAGIIWGLYYIFWLRSLFEVHRGGHIQKHDFLSKGVCLIPFGCTKGSIC